VSFTACKHFFVVGHGYQIQPEQDWGTTEAGTVIPPEKHGGWRYGPDHAWGVRDWETVVQFDREIVDLRRISKVPTAMLEILSPAPAAQLSFDLAVPNDSAVATAPQDSD
jgi:hypothetical protein